MNILLTGATGTVGQEFWRHVLVERNPFQQGQYQPNQKKLPINLIKQPNTKTNGT